LRNWEKMKIEIEVKYKIANAENIKKKLSILGFKLYKEIFQEDYYFSPPHKDFSATKTYYLRLRRKNQGAILAYHIVRDNLQTDEWEVKIDNFDIFLKILKFLDFKLDCIVRKNRSIYKKDKINIMIDKVKNLGTFIEIEYNKKFTKKSREVFKFLINNLDLKEKNLIKGVGYPDLLIDKKKSD